MYCTKKITSDLIWLGGSDRRLALFENVYPIPRGVSYNAYLIQDEKTALLDTVDQAIAERFFENLEHALQGKPLNYVIVNHMEPDHAATLGTVLSRYPEATVIGNAKTLPMIKQFFPMEVEGRFQAVKEGDTLSLGRHELTFVMAPLVHWPEVMMTYDTTEKALFSADAFGTFGAMDGNIFADEVNFEQEWLDDARRYYTNIVGKYGTPVQNVLKKAAGLDIQYLCPLHGPVWRENIGWFLEKYKRWSTYTPEAWTAAIFCGSIYGHTENAAEILAARLAERGVKNIALYDVSHTDVSYLVSEAFRCSHLVLASATYNGEIYTPMENFLRDLACHGLRGRSVALIENGTWAARSGMLMTKLLEEMKEMRVMEGTVTLKSSVKEAQRRGLSNLRDTVDCMPAYIDPKNIRLFAGHNILSETEMRARYEIHLENYCKITAIEANTLLAMIRRNIFPAVSRYTGELAETVQRKKALYLDCAAETELLQQLSGLNNELYETARAMAKALEEAGVSPDYVAGFSLGEIVGDTLFTHIEKADRDYEGCYQMLVAQFAQHFVRDGVHFINREDDTGDEGLRKAKQSYYPDILLRKFHAVWRG